MAHEFKAVVGDEFGPPETYRLRSIEPRPLASGQARVAIWYGGVSFVDVLAAEGRYHFKPELPHIPGSEFSGVVMETAPDVSAVAVGDRVIGGGFGGIFAEQIVVPAAGLMRVKAHVDMAEAAVFRGSFLTAYYSLFRRAQVQAGEVVLVLGAAGAVSIAAVQLAAWRGATVIASASSEAKRALAAANGATHVIDSGAADWRDQIKALTDGKGVNVIFDPVGASQTERAFRSLRWKGRHLIIGFAAGEIPKLPTNLVLIKDGAVLGVDMRQVGMYEPEVVREVIDAITEMFENGLIRPPIAAIHDLEDYAVAMKAVSSGLPAGRVLLRTSAADDRS